MTFPMPIMWKEEGSSDGTMIMEREEEIKEMEQEI